MATGVVHIPWYSTGFRGDDLQAVTFESKLDFDRWWSGQEMVDFRVICSGWYQIPVIYVWHDLVSEGRIEARLSNGTPALTRATT